MTKRKVSPPKTKAINGLGSATTGRWFVYMLECAGGRIYTGITPDVAARFEKHCAGHGAAFTRINKPVRVMATMPCGSRSEATKTESSLKKLRRPEKLQWAGQWVPQKDKPRRGRGLS